MTRRTSTSPFSNPFLIGAVTVLVTVFAVFISYRANSGLPFVPAYELRVTLPDGGGLQSGREVRIGGKRVGIVQDIDARVRGGRAVALADLKLEERFGPVRDDSVVVVRPLSPLGLKYLELRPGSRGRPLPGGATLPLRQSLRSIELADTLGAFEAGTRRVGRGDRGGNATEIARRGTGLVGLGTALAGPVAALAGVAPASAELGTGLAGRGAALNRALESAPPLLRGVEHVGSNLADRRTRLRGFLRGSERAFSELAAARRELGGVFESGDVTFGALASQRRALGETIGELPSTESAGTSALAAARPLLRDAGAFLREARPGLRALEPASVELHRAIRAGVPVLTRSVGLSRRLRVALGAVDRLVRDPATSATLRKLRATLLSLRPTLEFAAPGQLRCNYLGLFTRNAASTVSEGDVSGTWLRFLPVFKVDEMVAQPRPVPGLHVNPYASTGAPQQGGECEAGKEPYLSGQRIGHVPGFQGGSTESTSRRTTIPPPQEGWR